MKKESIHVKSNGIRNELKEIRKSIDALTKAILASNTQTYETYTYCRDCRGDVTLCDCKRTIE